MMLVADNSGLTEHEIDALFGVNDFQQVMRKHNGIKVFVQMAIYATFWGIFEGLLHHSLVEGAITGIAYGVVVGGTHELLIPPMFRRREGISRGQQRNYETLLRDPRLVAISSQDASVFLRIVRARQKSLRHDWIGWLILLLFTLLAFGLALNDLVQGRFAPGCGWLVLTLALLGMTTLVVRSTRPARKRLLYVTRVLEVATGELNA